MVFEKLGDYIQIFRDETFYDAIVGAIELPSQLIMFDSGQHLPKMDEFRKKLEEETGKKFTALILSHYHCDHTFGNQLFTDCRIIASKPIHEKMISMQKRWDEKVITSIKEDLQDKTALDGLVITLPNEEFTNRLEIIDQGIKIIIKQTGGHTNGSTHLYCPDYNVLFTGDNLFENSYPYGGDPSCNPEIWLNVLKEYLNMNIAYIVPGHGKITDKKTVKETITFMEKMKALMQKMHSDNKSKEEILDKCYGLEFYYYDEKNKNDVMLKKMTIERWYDVWIEGKV